MTCEFCEKVCPDNAIGWRWVSMKIRDDSGKELCTLNEVLCPSHGALALQRMRDMERDEHKWHVSTGYIMPVA